MKIPMTQNTPKITHALSEQLNKKRALDAGIYLLDMIELVQQLRGTSLAMQAGNQFFQQRASFKRQELRQHCLLEENYPGLDLTDSTGIQIELNTLFTASHESPYNAFILHSHVIETIRRQLTPLLHPHLDSGELRALIPTLIGLCEQLAQSRGMAVYIASTHRRPPEFISRLRFILSDIHTTHAHVLELLKAAEAEEVDSVKRRILSSECHEPLKDYLNTLRQLVEGSLQLDRIPRKHQSSSAHADTFWPDFLYTQATQVISSLHLATRQHLKSALSDTGPALRKWLLFG